MQTSILSIIEPLLLKLLDFPALVDSLKNKDHNFLELLEEWMKDTETILKNNNIAQCSKIAGFRSRIIAPKFGETHGRSTKKRQLNVAAESMFEIQETILLVIDPLQQRIDDARKLIKNLLSVLRQSGAIKYTDNMDFQYFINQIWTLCKNHDQLKPSVVSILAVISQVDALRIMAEEINLNEWK